jgi:hypothetical protein
MAPSARRHDAEAARRALVHHCALLCAVQGRRLAGGRVSQERTRLARSWTSQYTRHGCRADFSPAHLRERLARVWHGRRSMRAQSECPVGRRGADRKDRITECAVGCTDFRLFFNSECLEELMNDREEICRHP